MVKDSLDIQAIWVHFTPITLFCNRIELNDQTSQQCKDWLIRNTEVSIKTPINISPAFKLDLER